MQVELHNNKPTDQPSVALAIVSSSKRAARRLSVRDAFLWLAVSLNLLTSIVGRMNATPHMVKITDHVKGGVTTEQPHKRISLTFPESKPLIPNNTAASQALEIMKLNVTRDSVFGGQLIQKQHEAMKLKDPIMSVTRLPVNREESCSAQTVGDILPENNCSSLSTANDPAHRWDLPQQLWDMLAGENVLPGMEIILGEEALRKGSLSGSVIRFWTASLSPSTLLMLSYGILRDHLYGEQYELTALSKPTLLLRVRVFTGDIVFFALHLLRYDAKSLMFALFGTGEFALWFAVCVYVPLVTFLFLKIHLMYTFVTDHFQALRWLPVE